MWPDRRSRTSVHNMQNSAEGVERIHPNTQDDPTWRSFHRHQSTTSPTASEQTPKMGNSVGHIPDENDPLQSVDRPLYKPL